MKIKDVIAESATPNLTDNARDSLPGGFVIPELQNSDAYRQYRYGLALASAAAERNGHDKEPFERESPWAENLALIAITPQDEEIIRMAAKMMGVSIKEIATPGSRESKGTHIASPVPKQK